MVAYTLITGASAGIGREFARIFAAHGDNCVLVARRLAALDELAEELLRAHRVKVHTVGLDLSQPDAAENLAGILDKDDISVETLVNNAAFGEAGAFTAIDWHRQRRMINLNTLTLAGLCHCYGKRMADAGHGAILNVASTAGFMAGPNMAVYFATKAFVISFSEALSVELRPKGVTVTCLCPATTASEFQAAAHLEGSRLAAMSPVVSARSAAAFGYRSLKLRRVMAVHGTANRLMTFGLRFAPRTLLRALVAAATKP